MRHLEADGKEDLNKRLEEENSEKEGGNAS